MTSELVDQLLIRHDRNDPTLADVKHLDLGITDVGVGTGTSGASSSSPGRSKVGTKNHTAALRTILPSLPKLQSLSLSGMALGPRGAKTLLSTLVTNGSCPLLTELILSKCRIGFFGAKEIGSIGLPTNLEKLDLSQNELETEGVWQIKGALECLQSLKYLNLSRNSLNDDALSELGRLIPTLDNIAEIDLSNNNIQDNGASSLGTALSTPECSLKILNISNNEIGDDGARYLVESIASNTKLTSLDISNNNIQDDGGGEFVDKLGDKNHTLVNLNLGGNQISESRMRILDMLLKHRNSSSSCATSKSKTDQIQEEKTNIVSNSIVDRVVERASQIQRTVTETMENNRIVNVDEELDDLINQMDEILLKLRNHTIQ